MKTRAAVAFEAKRPLEIVEVDLEGPRAGEVLVEIKATGICHTDAYTLDGLDSEGIFPSILGHEGAVGGVGLDLSKLATAAVVEVLHHGRVAGEGFRRGPVLDAVAHPQAVGGAEGGHAGLGGYAGAGEDDEVGHARTKPLLPLREKMAERSEVG